MVLPLSCPANSCVEVGLSSRLGAGDDLAGAHPEYHHDDPSELCQDRVQHQR